MPNTLYLPELREMLASHDEAGLREFCTALHPGRTAEFMAGLSVEEAWAVLQHADGPTRVDIFHFFDEETQVASIEKLDRAEMAGLVRDLPPDDRVDILKQVDAVVVTELLPLLPAEERRDIQRLISYPEATAGAVMTTDVSRLREDLTARQALDEVSRQAEELETIYYLYVVDQEDHLQGLVSARELISAMSKPNNTLGDLMERDLVTALVTDDQEDVAKKVARYDLLAIPVVDQEQRLLGIITHDDIIDVVQEEAMEDVHRIGAVDPLDETYLQTPIVTMTWKRGIWLILLLFAAVLTAVALKHYKQQDLDLAWLVLFIPLVISSGGNSGSQSAALIISALSAGHIRSKDWMRVLRRELIQGVLLGGFLGLLGVVVAHQIIGDQLSSNPQALFILPITLVLVVLTGTLTGAMLPIMFHRFGLDPALMSTPLVAGILDIAGILLYMEVAKLLL